MLKVSHLTETSIGRCGINFDGTVVLQSKGNEYFIHPDDLKPGMFEAAASSNKLNIDQEQCDELHAVLRRWLDDGNEVYSKNTVRAH